MEQTPSQSPRRRFFRLAGVSTAAAALGSVAFGALARAPGGTADPAHAEERLEHMLKHLYVDVDATPEQQQKIDPIAKQAAKDLRPLREKEWKARRETMKLFSADKIDRGAIERLRAEQTAAHDAASKRFTRALTDVAEVLTPDQRRKLAARFEHRRHGRGRGGPGFG
ncbi:MAG: Spy/CpxP family protein refolding chaperone [Burkholderiales bacterium]